MKKVYNISVWSFFLMFIPHFLCATTSVSGSEALQELLTQAVYAEQFEGEGFYSSKSQEDLRKASQAIGQALKNDKEVDQLSGWLSVPSATIREQLSKAVSKIASRIEQRSAQEWTSKARRRRRRPRAKTASKKQKKSTAVRVFTPLMKAAQRNDIKTVECLLKGSVDINVQNKRDETALFIATRLNRNEVAKMLLQAGAHVNIAQKNGLTPLHQAIINGNLKLAQSLINAGADVNIRDSFHKRTPLMWVGRMTVGAPKKELDQISIEKAKELTDLLLTHGANQKLTDDQGMTALQWAKEIKAKPLIKMLQ